MAILAKTTSNYLKNIPPHHTLHRLIRALVVLGAALAMVVVFDIAFDGKINQLPDGHTCVHPHGLSTGDFERPVVAKTHVALAGSGVYVYAEAPYAGLSFEKGHRVESFGVFLRDAEVQGAGLEHKAFFFLDFKMADFVVAAGIQHLVFVTGQPFSKVYVVRVGTQTVAVEGFDDDLAGFDAFHYFFIAQNHNFPLRGAKIADFAKSLLGFFMIQRMRF